MPFLTLTAATKPKLNQALILEHQLRAGIKGYVTNLPAPAVNLPHGIPPEEVINAYHQLFQVEKSFRISKSDFESPTHFSPQT